MAQSDLPIHGTVSIPGDELLETASRSSGPGGQHVNKSNTRVTLRWHVESTRALEPAERARLIARLGGRLTREGNLVVHAQRHRSRSRNRELARERMAELVRDALARRRSRTKTKPTRGSRLRTQEAKQRRSQIKRQRTRPAGDD